MRACRRHTKWCSGLVPGQTFSFSLMCSSAFHTFWLTDALQLVFLVTRTKLFWIFWPQCSRVRKQCIMKFFLLDKKQAIYFRCIQTKYKKNSHTKSGQDTNVYEASYTYWPLHYISSWQHLGMYTSGQEDQVQIRMGKKMILNVT